MKKSIIAFAILGALFGVYNYSNTSNESEIQTKTIKKNEKNNFEYPIKENETHIDDSNNKKDIVNKRIEKIKYDMDGFEKPIIKERFPKKEKVYPDDFDPYFYVENFYVNDDIIVPYELIEKDSLEYEKIIQEVQEKETMGQIKEIYNVQPLKMMDAKALYYFIREGKRDLELINPYGEKVIVSTNNVKEVFKDRTLRIKMTDKSFVLRIYDDFSKIEYFDEKGYGISETFIIKLDKNGMGYSFNTKLKNRKSQIKFID